MIYKTLIKRQQTQEYKTVNFRELQQKFASFVAYNLFGPSRLRRVLDKTV